MTSADRFAAPAGTSSRGVFVTFEGGEGAGKSTHAAVFADALRAACGL